VIELEIKPGDVVVGETGTPLAVLAVEPDHLLLEKPDGTTIKIKRTAVLHLVLEPTPIDQAFQLGDLVRRLPAARTSYPASWFGKDAEGQPLPDMRPNVSELLATVTGFTADGYKVRTADGRTFRVSQDAIDSGSWVKAHGLNPDQT
jgi:hypothetical protein